MTDKNLTQNLCDKKIYIVIPSFCPDEKLLTLLSQLRNSETDQCSFDIILVDDGSGEEYSHVFNRAVSEYQSFLIDYKENKGKGYAFKQAFNSIIESNPHCEGVITADSDGQHTPSDIIACLRKFQSSPSKLILGVRDFEGKIPWRSRFGNKMTTFLFSTLFGFFITDTQTGLRAIPYGFLKKLAALNGERYDFEMNMLIEAVQSKVEIEELKISTVYVENNRDSHFNVFRDSARIYMLVFKRFLKKLLNFFNK